MPTAYTSLLGLALPVTGELSGTWGDTVNNAITSLLDTAIAGTTTLSTDADVTLTTTTGASNQARQAILLCNGARTAARNITAPATSKTYVVINSTTGGFGVVIRGAGPTTGVTIANGERAVVAWNGSDFVKISGFGGALTVTDLTVTNTATFSAGTANQVQYLNGSKVLSGSTNLTFDGTSLTLGGNPTLSAGTANGVLYLNGSKVATSGSALVFDGTRLLVQTTSSNISSSERLTVNGLATTSTSSTTVPAIYAQNSDTTASTNQPYIYLHDGVASRAGLGVNYTDSALVLNGFGGIYFRYGGNGMGTTEGMRLTSTGLGIGTSSPGNLLTLNKASGNYGLSINATGYGTLADFGVVNAGTDNTTYVGSVSNNPFKIKVYNQYTATFDQSGNLGLGVTPSAWNSDYKVIQMGPTGSIYGRVGTNEIALFQNLYRDTSGNFKFLQNGYGASFAFLSAGGAAWYNYGNNVSGAGAAASGTQAMTLDASGNLLVGTTSGSQRLVVTGADSSTGGVAITGTGTGGLKLYFDHAGGGNAYINNTQNGFMWFGTNNTERARITSGGYFKASNNGTYASSTGALHELKGNPDDNVLRVENYQATLTGAIAGVRIIYSAATPNTTNRSFLYCDDSTTLRAEIRSNGGLANYSANDVNLSDRREKTNFAPAKSYLDTICAIPVQTFNYIDQSEDDPGLTLGVVAQDVQAVAPELVMESNWGTEDNPKMRLSVYQTDLQYALMKCVQELKAQNDDLRARVAQLERQA